MSFFVIKNAVSCWIGVMRAAFRKRPILYGCIIAVGVMHVSVDELTTLTWVDWYNNRRLLERQGHIPPAEAEKAYYASIGNDDLAA